MADVSLNNFALTIPAEMQKQLLRHLFPGDGDEHGAIILAGISGPTAAPRLIARELHLAVDGVDYVPGKFGYRMLKAEFIQPRILRARDQKLAYLAIHNHGGSIAVGFSPDDLASHQRGYPALLKISRGMPVGALVFAQRAIAGELWMAGGNIAQLSHATVIGNTREIWTPVPRPMSQLHSAAHHRQSLVFGAEGQAILGGTKVGIIGLGGAGSIIAELLARLGVGQFVLADDDRISTSNLSRLLAAYTFDAGLPFLPKWLRELTQTKKVKAARRNILRANPLAKVTSIFGDIAKQDVASAFLDCDYIFLAADSMRARLVFNAIVQQYSIPGTQIGVKIRVNEKSEVGQILCVSRPVTPGHGCLWCNGLISAAKLQEEALTDEERETQRYVDDPDVVAPSVVTLNAISASHAVNEFMFFMTGLRNSDTERGYWRYMPRDNTTWLDIPTRDPDCTECSTADFSRLGRGDGVLLPTRGG